MSTYTNAAQKRTGRLHLDTGGTVLTTALLVATLVAAGTPWVLANLVVVPLIVAGTFRAVRGGVYG